MASLFQRKGVWYADFNDTRRTPNRRRHSLGTKSKKVARRLLGDLEKAYRLGDWDPWLQTANDYLAPPKKYDRAACVLDLFLDAKRREGLSPETLKTYKSLLTRFAAGKTYLELVSPRDIIRFCFKASLAVSTQRLRHRTVRAFLNWSHQEGHLTKNPIGRVKPPRERELVPRIVRPDDLEKLCKALRADYEAKLKNEDGVVRGACHEGDLVWTIPLFWFALYTGMRISELARLRWKHIDIRERLIYIHRQKNRKAQTIPLNSKAREILDGLSIPDTEREGGSYVFHAPKASSVNKRSTKAFTNRVTKIFLRYRRKAKLPEGLSVHGLRHGFCTLLAEKGKSAVVIKAAARHASIQTSMRYVHLANKHLADELEDVFG